MKYNNIIGKSIGVVFTTGLFGNYLINRKNTISKEDEKTFYDVWWGIVR
jgi:hypothetical protein